MATRDPVNLGTDESWVVIYDGPTEAAEFNGSIQHVGGGPAVLRVATSEPAALAGGFVPRQKAVPITIPDTEILYGRSAFGAIIVLS